MRILFISNFYPPARPGGYTQWCHEVAEELRERGHEIGVLTSRHEADKAAEEESGIYRLLNLDGDLVRYRPLHFFQAWQRERRENVRIVREVVEAFTPDLIFIWGMWAMSHTVPATAERLLPSRTVYFLSDYWPARTSMHAAYWRQPGNHWYTRLPRKVLGTVALKLVSAEEQDEPLFANSICVSRAVRDILVEQDIPVERARIIHGGTRLNGFSQIPDRDFSTRPLKALYAGQIVPHKGVDTAIEAMGKLINGMGVPDFRLDVVGAGSVEYESSLKHLVREQKLGDKVIFHGRVAKTEMPSVLRAADVLIFPSVYEEPFARMTQEAMLAGLVVVGTTTGGTVEILEEGENGLTFAPGNAEELASQLLRLSRDPDFCSRLASAGRRTVLESYTLDKMVDQIESYLTEVLATSE